MRLIFELVLGRFLGYIKTCSDGIKDWNRFILLNFNHNIVFGTKNKLRITQLKVTKLSCDNGLFFFFLGMRINF